MSSARDGRGRVAELAVEPVAPLGDGELPSCAIVVLNWNGLHHLDGCFESLSALNYPKEQLEVVLVDNGSLDGSVEHVRARHPWVRVVANRRNVGFSAGCNQGASEVPAAQQLVFLNMQQQVCDLRSEITPADATTA